MIDWLASCEPVNLIIGVAYIAAFMFYYRCIEMKIALLAIVVVSIFPVHDSAALPYLGMCSLYLICGWLLYFNNKNITAITFCLMSAYCLIFAFDSWINSDVETWIYKNHEIIVLVLHAAILLSFVDKLRAVVGSTVNYGRTNNVRCRVNQIGFNRAKRAVGKVED